MITRYNDGKKAKYYEKERQNIFTAASFAVIVTGQPVLAADFSAGEETFISETTEQEAMYRALSYFRGILWIQTVK